MWKLILFVGVVLPVILIDALLIRRRETRRDRLIRHYFILQHAYLRKHDPTGTEVVMMDHIANVFFGNRMPRSLHPDMPLRHLYSLVTRWRWGDDMEYETLIMDIEDRYGDVLPRGLDLSTLTITGLARAIDRHIA